VNFHSLQRKGAVLISIAKRSWAGSDDTLRHMAGTIPSCGQ